MIKSCCVEPKNKQKKRGLEGLICGLIPHTFCILFIVASVIGATTATTFFRSFLLLPYFFEILIGVSLLFATLSATFYLKRNSRFSVRGIRESWGYLGILYGTTLTINLLFFFVIFPWTANLNLNSRPKALAQQSLTKSFTLSVQIPCSGHAPLIGDELKKSPGVESFRFTMPNKFTVVYHPGLTSPEKVLASPVFQNYPAKIED